MRIRSDWYRLLWEWLTENVLFFDLAKFIVEKSSLLSFFVFLRQITFTKSIELSQSKSTPENMMFDSVLREFEETLKDTNLAGRELFSQRECLNFIVKLLNDLILNKNIFLTKAAEFESSLEPLWSDGIRGKLLEEFQSMKTHHGSPESALPPGKLSWPSRWKPFHSSFPWNRLLARSQSAQRQSFLGGAV